MKRTRIEDMSLEDFRENWLIKYRKSLVYLGLRLPEPDAIPIIREMGDGLKTRYRLFHIEAFNAAWDKGLKVHLRKNPNRPSWNYGVVANLIQENIDHIPDIGQKVLTGDTMTPEQREINKSWQVSTEEIIRTKFHLFQQSVNSGMYTFLTGSALAPAYQRKIQDAFMEMGNRIKTTIGEDAYEIQLDKIQNDWIEMAKEEFDLRETEIEFKTWREVQQIITMKEPKRARGFNDPILNWRRWVVIEYAKIKEVQNV